MNILSLRIEYEQDIVLARQRARQIAQLLGFDAREQTAISTAVSELVRNAYNYGRAGKVFFFIHNHLPLQSFSIKISDEGPGIKDLNAIIQGRYQSKTGMGMGIIGSRRLMDIFEIKSSPEAGTTIVIGKYIPKWKGTIKKEEISDIASTLAKNTPENLHEELRQQNQELLRSLDEVKRKQEELIVLNKELEDTNRGVVALYAELDEKAEHLKRVNEIKARFLSNMSHEFKTPLNSILGLSRILLDRIDGQLSDEQEKQVNFIRKSAGDLLELVNDLLDIAKVESGRLDVKPSRFLVADLFAALRGMLRPLNNRPEVNLIFEEPKGIPPLFTDEAKLSQILRNFISNALKFTEKGEVRVKARLSGENILFSVSDTGIGIAPESREFIFEEFTQIDSPIQKNVKGTGLGLPLSKKLALLLGGNVSLESQPDKGSVFYLLLPVGFSGNTGTMESTPAGLFSELNSAVMAPESGLQADNPQPVPLNGISDDKEDLPKVLVLEQEGKMHPEYINYITESGFIPLIAADHHQAISLVREKKPLAVLLDINMKNKDAWNFLTNIKSDPLIAAIPVLFSSIANNGQQGFTLGAEDFFLKPVDRQKLLNRLEEISRQSPVEKILVIDDQEVSRYLIREILNDTDYTLLEADSGIRGLQMTIDQKPDLILLDLVMPGMNGFEVLRHLKSSGHTRHIPVIIITSKDMNENERKKLFSQAALILSARSISENEFRADDAAVNIKDILRKTLLKQGER